MFFLASCCSCYGVMLLLWFLKGCLSNGDRHGSYGVNKCSEPDVVGVLVQVLESEAEKYRMKTFKTGRGNVKGGFTHPKIPFKSLWIERKVFCASNLLPGRMIRVTEKLLDRSYTVDFNTTEMSWLIVALREASLANHGPFLKQFSMGSRSLEMISESNRAGEFLKLISAFDGRNSRFLFIPAGKNREGWGRLSKFLAAIPKGGKVWVKKPLPPSLPSATVGSSQHREPLESLKVSSNEVGRGKEILLPWAEDSGWKDGFLPDMLKCRLKLCLGAPYSSGEANRSFAWRTYQSELGIGTVVVEIHQRDVSLGWQYVADQIEGGKDVCLADGADDASCGEHAGKAVAEEAVSVHGEEGDDKAVLQSDVKEFSSLGNLIPKDKILNLSSDALALCTDVYQAGGPSSAVLVPTSPSETRVALSLYEQSGSDKEWAEVIHLARALTHPDIDEAPDSIFLGEIMGFGDELLGSGYERAAEFQPCHNLGGLAAGSALQSFQFETIGKGSVLGNVHIRPDGSPNSRFLAKVDDITIFDNLETLSFDSPASGSSSRGAEESLVEVGVSCPEDLCVICGSIEPCGGFGGFVRW